MITPEVCEQVVVRRTLRDGDARKIVDLHERVYRSEYAMDERFVAGVAHAVEVALAQRWPESGGAVWLIDRGTELSGSLGLTDEGEGIGRVRFFVLEPEARGRGLGRSLLTELVAQARATGLGKLELETFSALTAAAHLYRDAGFELQWSKQTDKWGPPIFYQRYELQLSSASRLTLDDSDRSS
jgi:GNAT superfamily N-acetyltransferase